MTDLMVTVGEALVGVARGRGSWMRLPEEGGGSSSEHELGRLGGSGRHWDLANGKLSLVVGGA